MPESRVFSFHSCQISLANKMIFGFDKTRIDRITIAHIPKAMPAFNNHPQTMTSFLRTSANCPFQNFWWKIINYCPKPYAKRYPKAIAWIGKFNLTFKTIALGLVCQIGAIWCCHYLTDGTTIALHAASENAQLGSPTIEKLETSRKSSCVNSMECPYCNRKRLLLNKSKNLILLSFFPRN